MRLDKNITRRDFIRIVGAATTATLLRDTNLSAAPAGKKKLWKGFNLLNKFNPDYQTPFAESDFEIMAEWGFNFARIPLSYWCWSSEDDW